MGRHSLIQLIEHANRRSLDYLSCYRNASTIYFKKIFNQSSKEEREKVLKFIDEGDMKSLKEWITLNAQERLEAKPIQQLKVIASSLMIKNYSRMCKHELLQEIRKCEEKNTLKK